MGGREDAKKRWWRKEGRKEGRTTPRGEKRDRKDESVVDREMERENRGGEERELPPYLIYVI